MLKTLPPKSPKRRGFNFLEEDRDKDSKRNRKKRWILDLISLSF